MSRKKTENLVDEAVKAGKVEIASAKRGPTTATAKAVEGERKIVVRFTLPPSVNNLFINVRGHGRVKSPEYRQWIKDNRDEARRLKPPERYPVRSCYALCGKINRSRDGDNAAKAPLDLLVAEKVLAKDSLMCVTAGRWEYRPSDEEPYMLVWFEEIG